MSNTETIAISMQDLEIMKQFIEMCQSRGAIKAEEMADIGALYIRLSSVLNKAMAVKKTIGT